MVHCLKNKQITSLRLCEVMKDVFKTVRTVCRTSAASYLDVSDEPVAFLEGSLGIHLGCHQTNASCISREGHFFM
jgi:hypothetical protein